MRRPPSGWRPAVCALLALAACTLETRPPVRGARSGTEALAEARAEAEVRAVLLRYYADLTARDWRAFRAHFWPHGTLTTVWQPPGSPGLRLETVPVDTFIARAPEGPGSQPIFEERMTAAEVRVYGNLAQAWTRYAARFGSPGAIRSWEGFDAFTLMRHEGAWRIVSLAYTDKAP